jgi:hypothetical protein
MLEAELHLPSLHTLPKKQKKNRLNVKPAGR